MTMRRVLHAFCVVFLSLPLPAFAQGITLEQAAVALGAREVVALEYSGTGKWFRFAQAVQPGGAWPQNDVTGMVTTIDFIAPGQRVVMKRAESRTARARPALVQQVDENLNGAWAWGMVPPVRARSDGALDVQPQPAARDGRVSDVWATPQGFIRAALERRAQVVNVPGGADVTFEVDGRRFTGRLNERGDLDSVVTMLADPVLGDVPVTYTYSGYRDFPGLRFPTRIVRTQGGFPVWDYTVTAAGRVASTPVVVPDAVTQPPAPSVRIDILQLAEGVFLLQGGNYNSVAIEQANRVVVIEAPLDEARSLAVIGTIGRLIPRKPIKFVINTHTHFDHAGGLRTFVAHGATLVTDAVNRPFYVAAWGRPRTLASDLMAKRGSTPVFDTFTSPHTIPDPVRPVVVLPVPGNGHADGLAMVYLPAEKFLVEADLFAMPAEGARAPETPNPYSVTLFETVTRLGLDVRLIVPLHGRVGHMSDLRAAVGTAVLKVAPGACTQEAFYC